MHLMISSNKVMEQKRTRLSQREFKRIQQNTELYKNQTYKQLEATYVYLKPKVKEHIKEKQSEQEIKHRRKKQTKKEFVRENLQHIFKRSISKKALENSLKNKSFELYQRGINFGVKFENKNYRFKTLGLDNEYKQTLTKFTKRDKIRKKRKDLRQERTREKTQSFYRSR